MLKLDFGADYFWNDPEMRNDGGKAMSEIGRRGKVWIFIPKVGEKKIFMTYNTSFQDSEMLLVDRKSDEHRVLNMKKNQEEDYGFNAIHWEGDRLLASFSSLDVAELSSELQEGIIKFRQGTTLEEIESSENPVLMWVKFKEEY
jgi:basic membrane lipoprotein Med (substrate-binding protein (PBP1-ABC) superfamily)